MTLLDLAHQVGLNPHRASSTQGGEYKSACPKCGGKDRFFMQPHKQMKNCVGYYSCRQCNTSGDAIQFAMDFKGMDFNDAAKQVSAILTEKNNFLRTSTKPSSKPMRIFQSPEMWTTKANAFVEWAHKNIWHQGEILKTLDARGISSEVIRTHKIGWNPMDINRTKSEWAIDTKDSNSNKLWIPAGIVIPSLDFTGNVLRIKIRRTSWKPTDTMGKYIAVPGSMGGLTLVGNTERALMIIVESELDAYAIHNATSDFACIVAIGSNIKNPDNVTDYLAQRKTLLICHDADEGGTAMWEKWRKLYPHALPYPAPYGKDVGEAITLGLNVRTWILTRGWSTSPDKILMIWALNFISSRSRTIQYYKNLENEIALGSDSPRAKTGELQKGLTLMQDLVENRL